MRWSREKSCNNARGADAGEWAAKPFARWEQHCQLRRLREKKGRINWSENLVVSSCNAKGWDNQSELTMVSASPRNTPKFDQHRGADLTSRYCSSLHAYAHNRRFMSQARRTRHFAWSARWGEEKKINGFIFSLPLASRLTFVSYFEMLRSPCLARKAPVSPVMQASIVTGCPRSKYRNRPCCVTFEI